MKTLSLEQMESTEGGKFWGKGEWTASGPCTNGWQSYHRPYFAFWLKVAYDHDFRRC